MKLEEILEIALRMGTIILQSGAEIYRVETAIKKLFEAYRIEGECFVLSTGIILAVKDKNGQTLSYIKRVYNASTDLERLEEVNQFSRDLVSEPLSYEKAMDQLSRIENIPKYSFWAKLLASAVISFSFTFFFDGTYQEAIAAGLIAIVIYSLQARIFAKYFFTFMEYFLSALIAGFLCIMVCKAFVFLNLIRVIIGTIMILVPGTAITTAMKDALNGDILSSTYKFFETAFIATAISAGVGLSLSIFWR